MLIPVDTYGTGNFFEKSSPITNPWDDCICTYTGISGKITARHETG